MYFLTASKKKIRSISLILPALIVAAMLQTACDGTPELVDTVDIKVGVLLVAVGSRSEEYGESMEMLAGQVRALLSQRLDADNVRLAYIMEQTPNIASQMRAFDNSGTEEVIVVPLLIGDKSTVNLDYLYYLVGARSDASRIKELESQEHEIYYPLAKISVTKALGTSVALKKNVLNRVITLQGGDPGDELGVLLVGYGDGVYGQQMQEIMDGIGRYLKIKTYIDQVAYAFCGEYLDFSNKPIADAARELLAAKEEVLVVPVMIGNTEFLQVNTIQAAIDSIDASSRTRYVPTAVLPDEEIGEWVAERIQYGIDRIGQAGGNTIPGDDSH